MRIEIALISERHRLQHNQFFFLVYPRGKLQSHQFCWSDADEFVLFQFPFWRIGKRINDVNVGEVWSFIKELNFPHQLLRKMLVDLGKTFVVPRQRHILGLRAFFEIDPNNGMNVKFSRLPQKIKAGCRTVYIGQSHRPRTRPNGNFQQLFGLYRAVMEAVICVSV